jgi:predicted RNase H-like nuclease (RuvC/YqgF family)
MMTRADKLWIVVAVAVLGTWGCAQGTADHDSAQAERFQRLEAKCAKLEEDYRAVAAACEQAKRRVAALEADNGRLRQELADHKAVVQERDSLKKEVKSRTSECDALKKDVDSRTSERDALQHRCERLKKGIQNLLGQDDALLGTPVAPVTAVPVGPLLNPS